MSTIRHHLPARLGSRPELVLALLIGVGLLLRVAASLAIWPVGLGIDDSAPYTSAAAHSLLSDVQAPAGYPTLLAALGLITRQVAAVVVIQHLLGILSAIVFFVAVRRATGSGWLALLPAAGLLLGSDQIYLEHSVMAEGAFAIVLASCIYASIRVLERPRLDAWAISAGALVGAAALVRSAATAMAAGVVIAILLTDHSLRARIVAAATTLAATLIVLLGYATVNLAHGRQFSTGPDPGWHLYGMVAHYADCKAFTPPSGTAVLCQSTPSRGRAGLNFYLYDPRSPARQTFGYFEHDATVGAFARSVVWHQPGPYVRNVALNVAAYFVPSVYPASYGDPLGGQGLSPPLDWTRDNPDAGRLRQVMSTFYTPFAESLHAGWRRLLRGWERIARFGATALVITTLLTIAGLLVPDRRALLVLFGGVGLCFLIAPSVIGEYSGRYTVPMMAPMLTSAAIAVEALWRRRASQVRVGAKPTRRSR